jgi:hypothetical protein
MHAEMLLPLLSPQSYLLNVTFMYGEDDDLVEFDKKGDPPGRWVRTDPCHLSLSKSRITFLYIGMYQGYISQYYS